MRAALANAPDGVTFHQIDVSEVPLYNGDVEDGGLPAAVESLHAAVAAADGLMIFTPEYNGSYPAVTKNVIDWLSRPPHPWLGKGITLVVTTPGGMAGKYFRDHFDAVLGSGYFKFKHHPAMGIGTYGDKLDEDGELVDAETITALTDFTAAFADRCREPMSDEG